MYQIKDIKENQLIDVFETEQDAVMVLSHYQEEDTPWFDDVVGISYFPHNWVVERKPEPKPVFFWVFE